MTRLTGRALILGHDVNTDELHPSRFYSLNDQTVLKGFLGAVPGRLSTSSDQASGPLIVIAGHNFGCGSSRETGARVFELAGVKAVVAASFARIFQRNLVNLGLPALTCPALGNGTLTTLKEGQETTIDSAGHTLNVGQTTLPLSPMDPLHKSILDAGGLMAYLGLSQ